jgi:hypothetical protein
MADYLDTLIAPKLDRKTHKPIPSTDNSGYEWEYWQIKDYPGRGIHGSDSNNWDESDWNIAIDIFEDRIYGRFLNIIETIEKKLFSGFSVMALDCLLCETLQQFYDGEDESQSPTNDFVRFLTTSSFKQYFGTDNTPRTSMAAVFYNQIRCGILHQAEVKKTSLIKIEDKYSLVDWSDSQHTGLVVNRKKFHHQLDQEFHNYLVSLRTQPIIPTVHPWENFKKKMDFICRI